MAIELRAVSKQYALFDRPADRLKQMLLGGVSRLGARSLGWTAPRLYREFHALRDVSFSVARGEVLGIIGRNGAGKSTLLQIICGTLQPTSGSVQVRGRIAALLELGAGFNPEFTGRENIVMAATILGLSAAEIDQRMASIIEFSGIAEFIDQPVKTYSSGMYVRLAFSVATSIDPDILVIDEALSVGDGEFARRSFDRIMALKDKGATILFCSHAMYHVQVLCNRALWMEHGRMRMIGDADGVTAAYEMALVADASPQEAPAPSAAETNTAPRAAPGTARLHRVSVEADGKSGTELPVHSTHSHLRVRVEFASDPALPTPSVGVGLVQLNGTVVASAGSANDGVVLARDALGHGVAELSFPRIPLLKGDYAVNVFLLCERGIHIYDHAERVVLLRVFQQGMEQGVVSLPHHWDALRPGS